MKKNIHAGLLIVACVVSGSIHAMEPPESLEEQLHAAVLWNDVEKVQQLVRDTKVNINAQWKQGVTPLISAFQDEDSVNHNIVNMLLKYGANPNIQKEGGLTALHIAAMRNEANLVRALLQKGANPNIRATLENNPSPLDVATSQEVRRLLEDAMARPAAAVWSIQEKFGKGAVPPEILKEIAKRVRENQ